MSNVINNREYRKKLLKELITELHNGKSVDDVKQRFQEAFGGVSASEISEVEQALIMDGMPVSEVQRLCDVHASVFKGSIEEIHKPRQDYEIEGHPAHTLKEENQAVSRLVERIKPQLDALNEDSRQAVIPNLREDIEELDQINIHYQKKENLFFPYLEKYNITAPPKVMWGVDDEVRGLLKEVKTLLDSDGDVNAVKSKAGEAINAVKEMIFKEENILLPMMIETLTQDEWKRIAAESGEYGYCLIEEPAPWRPAAASRPPRSAPAASSPEGVTFPTGTLTTEELQGLLNTLPVDITFVGNDDTVRYFSQGRERIFARTSAIIGRKVTDCHPPASVHIVEKIVADLKSGAKDHEDFWLRMGEKYVLIRYYAVREPGGAYLGAVEVTQDIAPIQSITGEKRLMSE